MRCSSRKSCAEDWLDRLEPRMLLSSYVVDTLVDESDGDYSAGDLSLREAVLLANDSAGADDIQFDISLAGGTITLGGSEMEITESLDLEAPAGGLTIDANGSSRVFDIDTSEAVSLTGLTLTGGVAALGGAVLSRADLSLDGCVLLGNSATSGGGIYSLGSLSMQDCSVVSNSASTAGGGIYLFGLSAELTLINVTVGANAALVSGGGVEVALGTAAIHNSTIAGNSGAVVGGVLIAALAGDVVLQSSIVADNTTLVGVGDVYGVLGAGSTHNLIGDSATAGGLVDGVLSNIVGTDPLLGSLADNGGSRPSFLPAGASVAVDAGDNSLGLTTDQRGEGYIRTRGGDTDIGAIETNILPTLDALVASLDAVPRGDSVTFTASNPLDPDGSIASVRFYRDSDNNGVADDDELIGTDSSSGDGYTITLAIDLGEALGSVSFLAVAVDDVGEASAPAASEIEVINANPTINGFNAPVTATRTATVQVELDDAQDADGSIDSVNIYLDANGDALPDAAEFLGQATFDGDAYGYSWTVPAGLDLGEATLIAVAVDNDGGTSDPLTATVAIQNAVPTINSFNAPVTATRTATVQVELDDAQDADGSIDSVNIYLDANGDALPDAAEFLGQATFDGDAYGYSWTVPAGLDLGEATLIAVAVDNDGGTSDPLTATVAIQNAAPTINGFNAPVTATRGEELTLTVSLGEDADGTIEAVWFYLDSDGDGVTASDELLGTAAFSVEGATLRFTVPNELAAGTQRFLAVGVDLDGGRSLPAQASVEVLNGTPTLGGISIDTTEFAQGDVIVLRADGASDPDGEISAVVFYIDRDGDLQGSSDEELGRVAAGPDGFVVALASSATAGFPVGSITLLAVALDADGDRSATRSLVAVVEGSLRSGGTGTVNGASSADSSLWLATVNEAGVPVLFDSTTGVAYDLGELLGAPAAVDDISLWSDPSSGRLFAAYPAAEGLFLVERESDDRWTLVNLAAEFGDGRGPTRDLTQFASRDDEVLVVGLNDDNRLLGFQKARPGDELAPAWTLIDISSDLDTQGMQTPGFVDLISYVTPWNAWTIAGIDSEGDIQSVWIAPNSFTEWRADNLSDITGAGRLTGQLSVTQTSWKAINLAGVDEQGRLRVTWWVPRFGGQWVTSDLTEIAGQDALASGRVTGFVTSWGAINYVALDRNGDVVALWWTPNTEWTASSLTAAVPDSSPLPVGNLTSHVTPNGTINILGSSEDGDVLRLWWSPQSQRWQMVNETEGSERA